MSLNAELHKFYDRHGFGDTLGKRPRTVQVYTGCLLVPLPNIETRHRYLKYHDLHHLITGYSIGRIGEGQVSAWELGTGSMRISPILGLMNLIALSTGWVLDKRKMWAAFCRGLASRNLYSKKQRGAVDAGYWENIRALREDTLNADSTRSVRGSDRLIYAVYIFASLVIHGSIAIPAVIARTITDLSQGRTLRQSLQPVKRIDLY